MEDNELERLLSQRHKDFVLFDFNDTKVPCIIIQEARFDGIMKSVAGRPVSVETNLHILQDGLGHVFVRVALDFSQGGIKQEFLLYANESLTFFEALAETSLLALSSPHSQYGSSNVFMIQLPQPERAVNALDIIKKGLNKPNSG
ncbi:MAG: hypothetical protein AUI62_02320 [Thaumarchaeota archaeon 13_1_40CM_2_39_7]|nr:MAG: hypothetical protein AUI62_02320 [Thaumarchaeota archaeon 13_1_40CM_2_39_7]